ncbi:ABC transporter ATP-binding protein [Chryseosolibacter histidini]|uniref:ABC transporter ATP-binding protein n=1 Tax=Chryseosolibacter histidini TaxID=2782349 RepID=UPI0020B3E26B|nr:ATP-binding cassette domain-containing protein [Chryseosolibacter histidini]
MDKRTSGISITTEGLSKRFNREWIFRNFSYQFNNGTTYAITGPNGSGKSTLLQVLWGQVPQTSGDLHYTAPSAEIPVEKISQHIAIAAPYMDLVEEFTLREQLDFHFSLKPARGKVSPSELLEIMYLTHAKDKYIGNFSSGMKQRVKLGLAFYTAADLLFFDEPGTNLDEQAFAWYKRELAKLPEGVLTLIASNDKDEYPADCTVINVLAHKS